MLITLENKNDTRIEPYDLTMTENSRKYLIKIVETWLEPTSKTSKLNESYLKIIFMSTYYFKSIMRCETCLQFKLKCMMLNQEADEPCLALFFALPSTEKVKENH